MTNVMTEPTSRSRILGYLRHHNGSSAAEIGRALQLSAANIRYHLGILVSDGRVHVIGTRDEQVRGRPVQIYGLGESIIGDNLSGLAEALLEKILDAKSDSDKDLILHSLAARMLPVLEQQGMNLHITRRLAQVISRLNNCGYASRWEAHASAPRIIFEHCPYVGIVEKYPEICKIDAFLLEQNLYMHVEQIAKREKTIRGTYYCQFILRP